MKCIQLINAISWKSNYDINKMATIREYLNKIKNKGLNTKEKVLDAEVDANVQKASKGLIYLILFLLRISLQFARWFTLPLIINFPLLLFIQSYGFLNYNKMPVSDYTLSSVLFSLLLMILFFIFTKKSQGLLNKKYENNIRYASLFLSFCLCVFSINENTNLYLNSNIINLLFQ